MKKPTGELVLLYGFDSEKAVKIKSTVLVMGGRAREIPAEDYGVSIGVSAGMLAGNEAKEFEPVEIGGMMILHNFSNRRIDELLKRLNKAKVGNIPYKAVITETNKSWSAYELYCELEREHEAMKNGESIHNKE